MRTRAKPRNELHVTARASYAHRRANCATFVRHSHDDLRRARHRCRERYRRGVRATVGGHRRRVDRRRRERVRRHRAGRIAANRGSTCVPVTLDITDEAAVHDLAAACGVSARCAALPMWPGSHRRWATGAGSSTSTSSLPRGSSMHSDPGDGGTAIVCFASMAAHLNAQQANAAADAAIDAPLADDLFDAYAAAR